MRSFSKLHDLDTGSPRDSWDVILDENRVPVTGCGKDRIKLVYGYQDASSEI